MKKPSYMAERLEMLEVISDLYTRKLTNAAGGNLSVRADYNRVLITPTLMSENHRCRLAPEDLLLIDYDCNILEGPDALSRESKMHTRLLRDFPEFGAVIHAHPQYSMCFAAFSRPIPSVTEATEEMGTSGLIKQALIGTDALVDNTFDYFNSNRQRAQKMGLLGILPQHGVVAMAATLNQAFALVECVECDAMANLFKTAVLNATENI